ncbi:MAG: sterol desaturase family protein [Cypionkella sp.]
MSYELIIRLTAFLSLFSVFAILEALAPRRQRVQSRTNRWTTNFAIVAIDSLTLRAMAWAVPLLATGAAVDASRHGWGLLNALDWPLWLAWVVTILVFDFAIWLQHRISHEVPLFWRFHRVHHADRDFDVTTAIRFHPVEIAASMGLKIVLVYALGPPALAVVAFEVLLNGTALFNHANLRLPLGMDRALRLILVTPDMHRVHHSVLRAEHDSNYGFALSIWDRLFHTYTAQPAAGHETMAIGLQWQDQRPARLGWSLMLPFRK